MSKNIGMTKKALQTAKARIIAYGLAASMGLTACASDVHASEDAKENNENVTVTVTPTTTPVPTDGADVILDTDNQIVTYSDASSSNTDEDKKDDVIADESEEKKDDNATIEEGTEPKPGDEPNTDEDKEEVEDTTKTPEDLFNSFVDYSVKYGLTDREIAALVYAMNGDMYAEKTDATPFMDASNLAMLLNNAIDKITNQYYADANSKTFDISKAIIGTDDEAKAERKLIRKLTKAIKAFKKNPNKETLDSAMLSLSNLTLSCAKEQEGTYLKINQRDVATNLYSNLMFAYTVNNGLYNPNTKASQQIDEFKTFPFTFCYTDGQLSECVEEYQFVKELVK